MVNDFRYGYIRQGYSTRGVGSGKGDWVNFRFVDQPESHALTTLVSVPVHNIIDNFTWTRGKHTMALGGNWRGIQNNRTTDDNSYIMPVPIPTGFRIFPTRPRILVEDLEIRTRLPMEP